MMDGKVYLDQHGVKEKLANAVTRALQERPDDPMAFIAKIITPSIPTTFEFNTAGKVEIFSKVFELGQPMWEKLYDCVQSEMKSAPAKILSVGDGPGEPGCFMADKFGCTTICSDSAPAMVEKAQMRVKAKGLEGKVECRVIDMEDLTSIADASIDLLTSTHAYPFVLDQPKAMSEAMRVLKPGGVFGAVVWKSNDMMPFAGAMMGAVTGKTPEPPPPGAPPPAPLMWGVSAYTNKLLTDAGFEVKAGSEDPINGHFTDMEVAMKYCALPLWDKLTAMEQDGTVPDAWKKYAEAWPKLAKEKGYLDNFNVLKLPAVYRTIVAKKPA